VPSAILANLQSNNGTLPSKSPFYETRGSSSSSSSSSSSANNEAGQDGSNKVRYPPRTPVGNVPHLSRTDHELLSRRLFDTPSVPSSSSSSFASGPTMGGSSGSGGKLTGGFNLLSRSGSGAASASAAPSLAASFKSATSSSSSSSSSSYAENATGVFDSFLPPAVSLRQHMQPDEDDDLQ